jgi:phosphate starvation-inducible membrane PsiE
MFPACHAVAMLVNIIYSETVEWELVSVKFCSEKSRYEMLEVILT